MVETYRKVYVVCRDDTCFLEILLTISIEKFSFEDAFHSNQPAEINNNTKPNYTTRILANLQIFKSSFEKHLHQADYAISFEVWILYQLFGANFTRRISIWYSLQKHKENGLLMRMVTGTKNGSSLTMWIAKDHRYFKAELYKKNGYVPHLMGLEACCLLRDSPYGQVYEFGCMSKSE